jgi:FAD/FMN-containing dehydrogenase
MIGATIGAGVGPLKGEYGLIIDSLRSVDIVTATGDVVTASETQHNNLFWAVRGAGANFGIVVSATYEVYDAPNNGQVIVGDFFLDPASNISLWELLSSWDSDEVFPKEMGMSVAGGYDSTSGTPTLATTVSFIGTQEQAQPYLDKLIALNPLQWRNVSVGWNVLSTTQGNGQGASVCPRGQYANHFGVGTNRTDVATFTAMYARHVAFAAANDWFTGSLAFQRYGAATALALPVSKRGVYPWRDITLMM